MRMLAGMALGAALVVAGGQGAVTLMTATEGSGRAPASVPSPSSAPSASHAPNPNANKHATDKSKPAKTTGPAATPYGQVLEVWKDCVVEAGDAKDSAVLASCGPRPRPHGHAYGWDKNGWADGTKLPGRPDDKPSSSAKPSKSPKSPKSPRTP